MKPKRKLKHDNPQPPSNEFRTKVVHHIEESAWILAKADAIKRRLFIGPWISRVIKRVMGSDAGRRLIDGIERE